MVTTVTIDLRHIARGIGIPLRQVQAVVELLDDGNTVPFITRYRRDQTGGLDEEHIRKIQDRLTKMRQLADRKQTILRSIESQDKLTESLQKQILGAGTTKRLEDLYLPYKPKKQTLATTARSRGLEPLALEILEADPACADLDRRAADFVNTDRQVPTAADALLGSGHILAEKFSERIELRQRLREILQRSGKLVSTRIGGDAEKAPKSPESMPREKTPQAEKTPQGDSAAEAEKTPGETGSSAELQQDTPQAGNTSQTDQGNSGETAAASDSPEGKPTEPSDARNNPGENLSESGEAPDNPGQAAENPGNPGRDPGQSAENPDNPGHDPGQAAENPGNPGRDPGEAAENPGNPGHNPGEATQKADDAAESPVETPQAPAAPGDEGVETVETAEKAEKGDGSTQVPTAGADRPVAKTASKPLQRPRKQTRLTQRELKKKRAEEKKIKAFHDYFDFSEDIKSIPPHRVLAINRGERAKILRVKITSDTEAMHAVLDELLVPADHPHANYLRGCARDALARLILPALEREARRELTDRAEVHAVGVFARNLRNLLLQPPVDNHRVLAIDPGFKNGCKLAALDQFGNLLDNSVIYLVGRAERKKQAREKIVELVNLFQLSVVIIGNGTACRETEEFITELLAEELKDRDVSYVIVNEAGASVYSTSRLGREEFPEYEAVLRGAISIGRRLQDPLSELVKIDPASIGVGLYQHDVKAKHLRASLDEVVESCVNYVGVDVNTASPALLRYVSGLNQLTARRLYEYRGQHGPLRNREQLRDVAGFGETTFVQATGFLKITGGDNPLDATWIHPESYSVAGRVLEKLGYSPQDLSDKEKVAAMAQRVAGVNVEEMAQQLQVGTLTLKDILAQLSRPGRDPRKDLPAPVFKKGVLKMEDLVKDMELTGTVLNVVDFGAFVDIGMHDSGLVHVSHLADKFVRDPYEVVAVGDIVKVWVLDVDKQRRRVSLTMVQPGSERPRPERRGKKPREKEAGPKRHGRDGAGKREEKPRGSRDSRGPGRKGGHRSGEGRRGKGGPPPRTKYRPKPPKKPVIPITDAMKNGAEPMRTFGDLAQFFEVQKQEDIDAKPKKKRKDKEHKQDQPAEKKAPLVDDAAVESPQQPQAPPQAAQAAPAQSEPPQETTQSAPQEPQTLPQPPEAAESVQQTEETAEATSEQEETRGDQRDDE